MHDSMIPHCSFCEHFVSTFYTDMVTEWGYCEEMFDGNAPTRKETDAIRDEVKGGSWDMLNTLQEKGVLFVPTEIDCGSFVDIYPE